MGLLAVTKKRALFCARFSQRNAGTFDVTLTNP